MSSSKKSQELQLLVLGGAGSGKSTFIKQMRLHHGDGYPPEERVQLRLVVWSNVIDALHVVLRHMKWNNIAFGDTATQEIADWFAFEFPHQSHYALLMRMQSTEDAAALIAAASLADPPPESASSTSVAAGNGSSASRGSIAVAGGGESTSTGGRGCAAISSVLERYGGVADNRERIVRLWTDAGVQRCIVQGRRLEPQLTEAEEHYLNQLENITLSDYVPSVQDILYARQPTNGVQEHIFYYQSLAIRVIDVAGQRSQRRKWIHYFDGIQAVLFFVSLSGYCENLAEDPSMNNMADSLQTFNEVAHNDFLQSASFILILNKLDVFRERLKVNDFKTCFPDFEGDVSEESAIEHVKRRFLASKGNQASVVCHVTCAIDTERMKTVIQSVLSEIIDNNVRRLKSF